MEIEKQVCSLELAKKLKELGVKQEGIFWWITYGNKETGFEEVLETHEFCCDCNCPEKLNEPNYSAFTATELGEMLPNSLDKKKWKKWNNNLLISKYENGWIFEYVAGDCFGEGVKCKAKTEADARAKMLIYLLENNLITNPHSGI